MHREMGAPVSEGRLQLLDEEALAASVVETGFEQLVAARRHRKQLDLQSSVLLLQPLPDVLGLPERQPAAARRDDELHAGLSATSSRKSGHCLRLTGRRSARPSSTTSQCGSSSPSAAARSKPRIAPRATSELRWMRTKVSANSRSSATRGSSMRCSRSRVLSVTYFCSARRNTISRTGTSTIRFRSTTEMYS